MQDAVMEQVFGLVNEIAGCFLFNSTPADGVSASHFRKHPSPVAGTVQAVAKIRELVKADLELNGSLHSEMGFPLVRNEPP